MYVLLSDLINAGETGISFDNQLKNFIEDSFLGRNIQVKDGIHIYGSCFLFEKTILIEGFLEYELKYFCDRCLDEVEKDYKQKLSFSRNIEEIIDNKILFDDEIKETILLSIATKMLCKVDCAGLCQECGTNLNYEKCNCKQYKQLNNKFNINDNMYKK